MSLLDPKSDLVFKLLLTRCPELLPDMLSGVLKRPILRATIINPAMPTELPIDKDVAFDVRAELDDGSRVDVEMQQRVLPDLCPRLVYYGARDYGSQLDRGDGYHLLTPTAVVAWLAEPLFPDLDFHSIFELRSRNNKHRFSDQLAIHLLQLGVLSGAPDDSYAEVVQRWGRFFVADPAELHALAKEHHIMSTAKQTLEELSRDPHTQRLAREREDARKLYRAGLALAEAQGVDKGKAELLLDLLRSKFGPLTEVTVSRVRSAQPERLTLWAQRVLTAQALDEVLTP